MTVECSSLTETSASHSLPHMAQGTWQKRGWEDCKSQSLGHTAVKQVSSRHGKTVIYMSSQQLCLHAQDLHKIKQVSVPVWTGAQEVPSLAEDILVFDGCWVK